MIWPPARLEEHRFKFDHGNSQRSKVAGPFGQDVGHRPVLDIVDIERKRLPQRRQGPVRPLRMKQIGMIIQEHPGEQRQPIGEKDQSCQRNQVSLCRNRRLHAIGGRPRKLALLQSPASGISTRQSMWRMADQQPRVLRGGQKIRPRFVARRCCANPCCIHRA